MTTKRKTTQPNPQAVSDLHMRLAWWLAKREAEKREKLLKGRNRSAAIKI